MICSRSDLFYIESIAFPPDAGAAPANPTERGAEDFPWDEGEGARAGGGEEETDRGREIGVARAAGTIASRANQRATGAF